MQEKTLGINDLRRLGRSGNASAVLLNGTKCEIHHDGLYYKKHGAIIHGNPTTVKFKIPFSKALKQVQTIKRGDRLIVKRKDNELLAISDSYLNL